jgi:hypothetical protein
MSPSAADGSIVGICDIAADRGNLDPLLSVAGGIVGFRRP